MRKYLPFSALTVLMVAFMLHGCDGEQSTNVQIDSYGDGSSGSGTGGGTVVTRVDTVYIGDCSDCPNAKPDTVYVDPPPCPPCTGSDYEGIFALTDVQMTNFQEYCQYTFVTTTLQTVTVEEDMICFAGWMVEWDEATRTGQSQWNEYSESEGVFYDYTVSFTITFSDTDHLRATLSYHVEAGYVGSAASYACDDEFIATAERVTVEEAFRGMEGKTLPKPDISSRIEKE